VTGVLIVDVHRIASPRPSYSRRIPADARNGSLDKDGKIIWKASPRF
jgi:hypothetical protein